MGDENFMATFITGLVILLLGGWLYGKFVEHVFKPDDRETPAVRMKDGIDYVPMNKWKNALINLLNIAGTGPIFGPIQGILFGPIAFITIPIGCVISGATHDYLSGMMSLRQNGAQMPGIIRKFLGNKTYQVYNIFLCFLMLLVGAVFTYTPGDLFAGQICGFQDVNVWTWVIYGVILLYYLVATLFPIDKIIGKIYPIFGAILLLSAVGVFAGIFIQGYQLDNIDFSHGLKGIFDVYPIFDAEGNSGAGTKFIPVFFVTVACGITSGFHSTQCTLIGRSVEHEKEGRTVFYGMMILEGLIAMIWAAAAMSFFGGTAGLGEALGQGGAAVVVNRISSSVLGKVGGALAILGVVACPITSGDTAFRSARLTIADAIGYKQGPIMNRFVIAIPLFMIGIALCFIDFNILWRYFSWSNQTLATIALWAAAKYLANQNKNYKIALIPAIYMTVVVTSYIIIAPEAVSYTHLTLPTKLEV